jgi:hypothetical protein
MGAFDVAVAVGFLVAARRPARAMGMLALTGVAATLLVLTAIVDLALGHTSLTDEAPHLLVVAGWLLLHRLAVVAPPSFDRPQSLRAWLGRLRTSNSEERLAVLNAALTRPEGSTGASQPTQAEQVAVESRSGGASKAATG